MLPVILLDRVTIGVTVRGDDVTTGKAGCAIVGHVTQCLCMGTDEEPGSGRSTVPFRTEMEQRLSAKIVTYDDHGVERPGGMCGCCGAGPNANPDWRGDPWYVYQAGLCDVDQVYYSMLCEGCLEEIRAENGRRPETERDIAAREIAELLGDDLDGAQSMMDDMA